MIQRIGANMNITSLRFFGWILKKVWRQIYQGIHVGEEGLRMVREAIKKAPVVLIPTHRSYVDFLIVSYIFFEYNLPVPRIAAGEDFLAILIIR
jgi:glyceronephosphate O-acyltransferase